MYKAVEEEEEDGDGFPMKADSLGGARLDRRALDADGGGKTEKAPTDEAQSMESSRDSTTEKFFIFELFFGYLIMGPDSRMFTTASKGSSGIESGEIVRRRWYGAFDGQQQQTGSLMWWSSLVAFRLSS